MSSDPISSPEKCYAISNGDGIAASFKRDLDELGTDGFADWLTGSFGGPDPWHRPGWFHSDSDLLFSQLFRQAAPVFPAETLAKARAGIEKALAGFKPPDGTLFGLLELTGVVEAVNATPLLPKIAEALFYWFDPVSTAFRHRLDTRDDVLSLREILECAFRMCPPGTRYLPPGGGPFMPIGDWSRLILVNHPHALQRAFVPAYAPLYMLSLCSNGMNDHERRLIDKAVQNGWRTLDDPFQDLFAYESVRMPGLLFPYNIDRLTAMAGRFTYDESNDIEFEGTDDPFAAIPESATSGNLSTHYSGDTAMRYVESLAA